MCIDELPDLVPGFLKGLGGFYAKVMDTTVDVAVILLIIIADGPDDLNRLLRGCGIIKIDQRPLVNGLGEDGEVGADVGDVKGHVQEINMNIEY